MFEASKQLIAKRDAVLRLARELDVHGVIASYPKEEFTGKLNHKIAMQAMSLDLTADTIKNLNDTCDMPFMRDNRTAVDYGLSLVFGWLVEDIIIKWLQDNGFVVKHEGSDKFREFLNPRGITTDLDIHVLNPQTGKSEKFDIYNDSRDYWVKNDKMDIRLTKWVTLVKHNAAMFCVSSAGMAIIDTKMPHTIAENPLWGNKKAATIQGVKGHLQSPQNAIQSLQKRLS